VTDAQDRLRNLHASMERDSSSSFDDSRGAIELAIITLDLRDEEFLRATTDNTQLTSELDLEREDSERLRAANGELWRLQCETSEANDRLTAELDMAHGDVASIRDDKNDEIRQLTTEVTELREKAATDNQEKITAVTEIERLREQLDMAWETANRCAYERNAVSAEGARKDAVVDAAMAFADEQACLDPECTHKICVLNAALEALDDPDSGRQEPVEPLFGDPGFPELKRTDPKCPHGWSLKHVKCGECADDGRHEPRCPGCGGEVRKVRQDLNTSCLNADQFDAIRAGDYYCEACPDNGRGKSKLCYWWEKEVTTTADSSQENDDG